MDWYATLNKPALTPPGWIFAPVWSLLYLSIAVSILIYYLSKSKQKKKITSWILIFHLISNFCWTSLFFGLQAPGLALIDIIFMDVTLIFLMVLFWKSNKFSSLILIPYLLWILFATYLNFEFLRLN